MANNYYNFNNPFIPGTKVRSEAVNAQLGGVESGFDLLPTDPVANIIGTAWFGTETQGATVNEFQVTTPDPQTSLTNGQRVAFFATHTNDGAATLDVDGTGTFAMVNFNGSAFVGMEVVSGQWYEFVWDNANTQWIVAAAVDNALQVTYAQEWANNAVGVLVSAAAGGDQVDDYSALHWSTGASEWATRAEDDPIPTQFGGDGVTDFSAFHWAQKSQATSGLPTPTADQEMIYYDSGAAAYAVTGTVLGWNQDDSTLTINVQGANTPAFIVNNIDPSGVVMQVGGSGSASTNWDIFRSIDNGGANYWFMRDDHGLSSPNHRLELQHSTLSIAHLRLEAGGEGFLFSETAARSISVVDVEANPTDIRVGDQVAFRWDQKSAAETPVSNFGEVWLREGAAGDPLWSEVEMLADFEGSDGATSYTEISDNAAVATFNGTAQLDTAQAESGSSSLLLDGNSDWVTFPDIAAYDLGTQDWTIEGFVRFNTLPPLQTSAGPGFVLFDMRQGGNALVQYGVIQDGFGFRVRLVGDDWGAEVGTISGGISTGVWYHWAVTRSSGDNNIRAYFNGNYEVADFGVSPADIGNPDEPIIIGCRDATDAFHDGWIDNVRMTIGTARYSGTGSYSVPSTPYLGAPDDQDLMFTSELGNDYVLGGGSEATPTLQQVTTQGFSTDVGISIDTGAPFVLNDATDTDGVLMTVSAAATVRGGLGLGFLGTAGITEYALGDVSAFSLTLQEKAAALANVATLGELWLRDDGPNTLMFTDDAGTDYVVAGALQTAAQISGTPVDNQIAVWDSANSIEGDPDFTWSGTVLALTLGGNTLQISPGSQSVIDVNAGSELALRGMDENDNGLVLEDGMRLTFEDLAFSNDVYCRNEGIGGSSGTLTFRTIAAGGSTMELIGMNLTLFNSGETASATLSQLGTSPQFLNVNRALRLQGPLYLLERSAADADNAGLGQLWVELDTPNRLKFTDDSGQDYDVAMVGGYVNDNVFLNSSRNFNSGGNFAANNILYYSDGSNNTITLEDSTSTTNWPVYTSIQVIAPGSGNQTITEGSGTTLFDDAGADTVGGVTLSGGVVTIFRASTTDYIIWGSGYT